MSTPLPPVVAEFAGESALIAALGRLDAAGLSGFETYTPYPVKRAKARGGTETSQIPLFVLVFGLLGFGASMALQSYADTMSYPQNIGGRPFNSWMAFIPTAFENGILCAVVTGFIGFFAAAGLPHLGRPTAPTGDSSRDSFVVAVPVPDTAARDKALTALAPPHDESLPP